MATVDHPDEAIVEFADNRLLVELCGEYDSHLAEIERVLGVQIVRQGNRMRIHGEAAARAAEVLRALYARLEAGRPVDRAEVARALAAGETAGNGGQLEMFGGSAPLEIVTRRRVVEPRTPAQRAYVEALFSHDLVFGIGPAGTGKTYLAVAAAVAMFIEGRVDRIVLSRPAVEAGERLGFLPGDMREKVDPYMQPLYDALHDFLPARQLGRMMEERRIEIAPLAFMRGRTLTNAFVVLDEAQNATEMQMKMFLTRMGEGTRMAVTGDRTQVDLARGVASGLEVAERLLAGIEGIAFRHFTSADVVRHPLVRRIIEAWDERR